MVTSLAPLNGISVVITFFCLILTVVFAALGIRTLREERSVLAMSFGFAAVVVMIVGIALGPRSYELVKSIGTLLMPAGLVWTLVLLLLGLAIAFRGAVDIALLSIVAVAYTVGGSAVVGAALTESLESGFYEVDPFAATYDVVHVLGGGTASRKQYVYLAGSGDRVALAARLYNQGNTALLLTTGSTPPSYERGHDSARATARIWRSLGIPERAIIVRSQPHDTEDELRLLAELVAEHNWQRVGMVTSARHMPRAMNLAEKYGVDVSPLPAGFSGGVSFMGFRSMIPTGAGFASMHAACWEYVGRVGGQ